MAKIITYDDKELRVLGECAQEMSKLDDMDARQRVLDYLTARFMSPHDVFRQLAETMNAMNPTPAPSETSQPPDDLEVNP